MNLHALLLKEDGFMKKILFIYFSIIFVIISASLYAQMSRLSLSERIQMSELVIIVQVEKTYKGEGEEEDVGNWFAECKVKEI